MFSADLSSSSADLQLMEINPPCKTKAFEYQFVNGYGYGKSHRFADISNSREKRYSDASKLYFQRSSILKENNGEYTILNAVGEVDFHSSIDSMMNKDTVANSLQGLLNSQRNFENILKGTRSIGGMDETKATDIVANANETKSTHSIKDTQNPEDIEHTETVAPVAEVSAHPKTKKPKRKRISASKRQKIMMKEYEKLSRSLSFLVKSQKPIPANRKGQLNVRRELLGQVRRSLKSLRRKLRKREKIYQFEVKERLHKEHRKRVRHRLRKILRVVYSKRKQRIRNMRNLRIQERKRVAENLLFKAAKLRSRANRLTAGRESRFLHRQVQLPKKPTDPIKIRTSSPVIKKDLVKSEENSGTDKVLEKRTCEKKKHKKKLTKKEKQKKKLDYEVKIMGTRVKKLLKQFSNFCKAPARRRAKKILAQLSKSLSPKDEHNERLKGGATPADPNQPQQETSLKKKSKKKKRKRRHLREAWWRKDRLKAAKIIPKELPKIDDFGSDSDLYDVKIIDTKRVTPRPSQITAVKSFASFSSHVKI